MFIVKNEIKGKISLSLDAWTSSNNYAFLAIIAHYINKNGNLGMCMFFYLYNSKMLMLHVKC